MEATSSGNTLTIAAPSYEMNWKDRFFDRGFTAASYLTDPLLKAQQWTWGEVYIIHEMHPQAGRVEKCVRIALLLIKALASLTLSIITTLMGIALRFFLISLQSRPFLHQKGDAPEKRLAEKTFTLYSQNFCGIPGSYSITDGGVLPWAYRINGIVSKIREQDADVVCLTEIFDIQTAHKLIEELKDQYAHFYYNIAPRGYGAGSGLFVASKFKIDNPEFTLFPQAALDERAKYSNKGFFSFEIINSGESSSYRIYTTHFGHSEVPGSPTLNEINARNAERSLLLGDMEGRAKNLPIILTGDLNLDTKEFDEQHWGNYFDRGDYPAREMTWGGDRYPTTRITNKTTSPASVLDYTMAYKEDNKAKATRGVEIKTDYVDTGFVDGEFKLDALSDHKGLLSTITLESGEVSVTEEGSENSEDDSSSEES